MEDHIGELETAVRWKLNAMTLVYSNSSGNQSKRGFDLASTRPTFRR